MIDSALVDCMYLFEQSFEVLTTLQEDPNVEHLETEACEIQHRYEKVKGTTQMVSLTQRLALMQHAKALKEWVDATRRKEAVLKERLQPWIDEVYRITASIEANLTQLQTTQETIQGSSLATTVIEQHIEEVHQAAAQCVAELAVI